MGANKILISANPKSRGVIETFKKAIAVVIGISNNNEKASLVSHGIIINNHNEFLNLL